MRPVCERGNLEQQAYNEARNGRGREPFRHESILTAVCRGMITGLGWRGYILALEYLVEAQSQK